MTFREIVELRPLPRSDFREPLLRCAEEYVERICADVCRRCKAACDAVLAF
jgi:hypothetical protein